jgi:L,D-transpeptidase-like protein
MRRSAALLATAALALAFVVVVAPAPAGAAVSNTMTAGHQLSPNRYLRSSDGAYRLTMRAVGDLVITHHGRAVWGTHTTRHFAHLSVRHDGTIAVVAAPHILWSSGTAGSGTTNRLVLGNDGRLVLRNSRGVVWSNVLGNGCGTNTAAKRIIVSIGRQLARMCAHRQQILTSPVTTGASAHGNGTPQGSWRVQAKQRNRYLYPAGGGAYYVHYWMPYNGDYGFHDSSWQHFPYGSSAYRTQGSHGCVHMPASIMAWVFGWSPVGTSVTIKA